MQAHPRPRLTVVATGDELVEQRAIEAARGPVIDILDERLLAQLLGASRQRVNQELKAMEREETIRIEPGGLVVRNREALMRITEADD